jgi:flagellin-specific chaperone FliS
MDREGIDAYKRTQVMGCSPGQLVLTLYDHIISCLKKSDMPGASKGLVELMSALDLDYQEVSGRLFSLYEYCLDLVKKQKYEEASRILTEMRAMWVTAIKNMTREETTVTSGKEG